MTVDIVGKHPVSSSGTSRSTDRGRFELQPRRYEQGMQFSDRGINEAPLDPHWPDPEGPQGSPWQPSLFAQGEPSPDPEFTGLVRHQLDSTAWADHVPGWLTGANTLFEELLKTARWEATTQELYGKVVVTPRLVTRWPSPPDDGGLPPVVGRMRELISRRYERDFDSVSANLYRDGRDSVAWHGDHIPRRIVDPIVATVSLGYPRRFAMRPREGRTELSINLDTGDLVVMGGTSQRTWLHTVPKVAKAGPRISVAFRHS